MKNLLLFLTAMLAVSCSSNSEKNRDTEIFEHLQKLEADQIAADIEIDGEQVLDKRERFNPNVILNADSCHLSFENSDGANIRLKLEGENWHNLSKKRISFKDGVLTSEINSGSFSILQKTGKEFTLKDGWAEIRQLNQEACIITIHGMLKSSELNEPTKPINGLIVWKKPKELDLNSPFRSFYF
ncbi:hypothetical protein [Arcticibacterium luteifluviistationis]|uniref:Uncharacterized protein n=1 Tax=Arcticibacterium luteifluviistationis TaxID=1784714 RepID=A0A2Z4GGM0_9BACT|nr:hypothetical protein [Arcticibacterium luteifluviistationis]AWV99943.1 hypothetical protein DJ013_17915 [Arcticibacterium luteifluviistationis]